MSWLFHKILKAIRDPKKFGGSRQYWESRYRTGGNSGGGSYGKLALYKAEFLNKFIAENQIKSVLEWGCGDGNQASLLQCSEYLGLDISPTAISICRKKFEFVPGKSFALNEDFSPGKSIELALSLDVLYHLVEDKVFETYVNRLFESATKYVIIYSCNFESEPTANHVKPRRFTNFVELHFPQWELIFTESNPFPMTVMNDPETSWSNFFIYGRRSDFSSRE